MEVNLRFPGQYSDSETGLHYNWHRYYDPVIGRYSAPDPIIQKGEALSDDDHAYSYAGNKPFVLTDPTGTRCQKEELFSFPKQKIGDPRPVRKKQSITGPCPLNWALMGFETCICYQFNLVQSYRKKVVYKWVDDGSCPKCKYEGKTSFSYLSFSAVIGTLDGGCQPVEYSWPI